MAFLAQPQEVPKLYWKYLVLLLALACMDRLGSTPSPFRLQLKPLVLGSEPPSTTASNMAL
jgi:hypothetical protein